MSKAIFRLDPGHRIMKKSKTMYRREQDLDQVVG